MWWNDTVTFSKMTCFVLGLSTTSRVTTLMSGSSPADKQFLGPKTNIEYATLSSLFREAEFYTNLSPWRFYLCKSPGGVSMPSPMRKQDQLPKGIVRSIVSKGGRLWGWLVNTILNRPTIAHFNRDGTNPIESDIGRGVQASYHKFHSSSNSI